MNRAAAYDALARELERWRAMPLRELIANIGKAASAHSVRVNDEDITIEVTVHRKDRDAIRITATANGPSHWRLERLEESIIVQLSRE